MPIKLKDIADKVLLKAVGRTNKRRINRIQRSLQQAKDQFRSTDSMDTKARLKRFLEREARLDELAPKKLSERKPAADKPAATAIPEATGTTASAGIGLERRLTNQNNLLSIEFLEEGREASRAVVRIVTPTSVGTGFFVAPNIIMTNHHVVKNEVVAAKSDFDIFAEDTRIAHNFNQKTLFFEPKNFFFTDANLDITLIAVESEQDSAECGWLPLFRETGKILIGHPVNVIQHPSGGAKKIVAHNSILLDLEDQSASNNFCWYSADTEQGSSGSPVFNNRWEVIALHHKSVPATNKNKEILDINGKVMSEARFRSDPHMVKWIANEGIRVSKIVEGLEAAAFGSGVHAKLRDRVLALWANTKALRPGLKSGWLN